MKAKPAPMPEEADAYSIEDFCRRHGISAQTFYKFPDIMPKPFTIGTRRLISREAAARWRREREEAEATGSAHSAPPAPGTNGPPGPE